MKAVKRKTSLYLDASLSKEIAKFAPHMSQTEFAHMAMASLLEQLKADKARNEFLKKLSEIKPVKRKTTALQTLHKLRKQREKQILNNIKN